MSRDTKVWASAAKEAPIIKYLPISKTHRRHSGRC
jgi:hypothetical protein